VGLISVVGLLGYIVVTSGAKGEVNEAPIETVIGLGDDLLDDDLRKQLEVDREHQEETNRVVDRQIRDINNTLSDLHGLMKSLKSDSGGSEPGEVSTDALNMTPESSLGQQHQERRDTQPSEQPLNYPPSPTGYTYEDSPDSMEFPSETLIGGIALAEGAAQPKDEIKKKGGVYLSPGFMDGMLLTGLKAETIEGANENPEPMMIRVQAPAVLPNSVKANLKGCFVIAHGFGKLNKERIEARLVSLHCLNRREQAVIDEKIKGFIVDADGAKGIAGHVVMKAGANAARMFLSGMIGGFGEGIEESNTASSITALGTTVDGASDDSNQTLRRGFGKGVGSASNELSKVFLDLVKQSSPVIEVGPAKKVTLSLTEGVYLDIRDINEFKR
jgi:conjugal transfer pilus assembly protein TraB